MSSTIQRAQNEEHISIHKEAAWFFQANRSPVAFRGKYDVPPATIKSYSSLKVGSSSTSCEGGESPGDCRLDNCELCKLYVGHADVKLRSEDTDNNAHSDACPAVKCRIFKKQCAQCEAIGWSDDSLIVLMWTDCDRKTTISRSNGWMKMSVVLRLPSSTLYTQPFTNCRKHSHSVIAKKGQPSFMVHGNRIA